MKSSLHTHHTARALALAGLGALLSCGLLAPDAGAVTRSSPAGNTWDCLLSGSRQQGIAYLTFYTNGTFDGIRILAGKARGGGALSTDGRSPLGIDEGRIPFTSGSISANAPLTNLFGFDSISGPWSYDERGRVIGNFAEYVGLATTTYTTNENITPLEVPILGVITNADNTVVYYTNLTTIYITNEPTVTVNTSFEHTNRISFVGSVVPHRRLTLVASTPSGKVTYSGVPVNTHLSNLSGNWYATRTEFNQSFVEFFTLWPDGTMPNLYFTTNGTGPGYTTKGVCLLSSRRKIGFSFQTYYTVGTNADYNLSASYGSFSSSSSLTKADTRGFEMQPDEPTAIRFRAVRIK